METPPPDYAIHRRSPAPSWPLLLAMTAVICGTAALMDRNTYYTEGEVMQGVYRFATVGMALLLFMGFANRTLAAWLILFCGGALILWQANQQRRWGILHEEIVTLVWWVKQEKNKSGRYPPTLAGYSFRHPEFKEHVGYGFPEGKIYINYYLNDSGISYWYQDGTGFGYYAD